MKVLWIDKRSTSRLRAAFLPLLLTVVASCTRAGPPPFETAAPPAGLTEAVDRVVAREMELAHIPGAVVVVVKDGKIVFEKGYGYSDLEAKRPVTPERTIFRIGSISKVFTATAVVQLADRGAIELDRDVNDYLGAFKIPATYSQPVTAANLLTHSGGFDEINLGRKATDPAKVVPLGEFLKTRLVRRGPPGQATSYSTYGISLAGYLVEAVSKLDFRDYLRRNIFGRLGMERTSMGAVSPEHRIDLATGYDWIGGRHQPLAFEYFHTYPASDVNSTARDMARFMLAHLEPARPGSRRLFSDRARLDMQRTHFTNHPDLLGFTYGFFENRRNGVAAIEHGGTMDGFAAHMYLAPGERLGVFVAGNRETNGLRASVKQAVLDHYFPYTLPAAPSEGTVRESSERFAGRYMRDDYCHSCPPGARGYVPEPFTVRANADGSITLFGARWVQVKPLVFQLTGGQLDSGETRIAFRQDGDGRITHMINATAMSEKLEGPQSGEAGIPFPIDPQLLASYAGTYKVSPGQEVVIALEAGKLTGQLTGLPKVELTALSESRFTGAGGEASVTFFKDSSGKVTHLILVFGGKEMQGTKTP